MDFMLFKSRGQGIKFNEIKRKHEVKYNYSAEILIKLITGHLTC